MINAEKQRLAKAEDKIAQRSCQAALRSLIAARERIERAIDGLIGARPLWRAREDLLKSVPGIDGIVARTLWVELAELGSVDRHQVAALAGVAPINRDSGRSGGSDGSRAGGSRCAPRWTWPVRSRSGTLRAFYRRLRGAGQPAKLALVAVMRKLLTILNAILRDGRPWADPAGDPRARASAGGRGKALARAGHRLRRPGPCRARRPGYHLPSHRPLTPQTVALRGRVGVGDGQRFVDGL